MNPGRVRLQRHLSVKAKIQPTSSPKARSSRKGSRCSCWEHQTPQATSETAGEKAGEPPPWNTNAGKSVLTPAHSQWALTFLYSYLGQILSLKTNPEGRKKSLSLPDPSHLCKIQGVLPSSAFPAVSLYQYPHFQQCCSVSTQQLLVSDSSQRE